MSAARQPTLRRACRVGNGEADVTLTLVNGAHEPVSFRLPAPARAWRVRLDSSRPDDDERDLDGDTLEVPGRTVMLLAALAEGEDA